MVRALKTLEKMRASPQDWLIADVETVCRAFAKKGLTIKAARGSHHTIRHQKIERILTIPAKRPIKAIYIRRFVEFVDEVLSMKE